MKEVTVFYVICKWKENIHNGIAMRLFSYFSLIHGSECADKLGIPTPNSHVCDCMCHIHLKILDMTQKCTAHSAENLCTITMIAIFLFSIFMSLFQCFCCVSQFIDYTPCFIAPLNWYTLFICLVCPVPSVHIYIKILQYEQHEICFY